MKRYHWLISCIIIITGFGKQAMAQQLFTADDFIRWVKEYHPVARQAGLQINKADAELMSARGGFDPTVGLNASRKTFDGKNYYYYTNPELKIPTPIGIDIKTGLENNGGNYITSEVTKGKTSYLGVEVPLGKGLLFDKRRAVLQQAKIYRSQTEQEQLSMLNDLMFDAYVSYWQWAGAYQLYSMYTRYIEVAGNRLRLLRIAQANGDKAVMDTLEAYTQIQVYRMSQAEALLKLNNTALELSNYLWMQNDSAVLLPAHYLPDTLQFAAEKNVAGVEDLVSQALVKHPDLRTYQFKLEGLEVEKRLKFQSLLPYINVKANLLNKDYYVLKDVNGAMLENNYKWGIELKMPLLLREGRGDYKKAKLKIQETNLQLENKRWQLTNKIRSYYNEYVMLQQQLHTTAAMYHNYHALLRNEELKFSQGESSLFVINSRESKLIELLQKQTELRVKYLKAAYAVSWAAGGLP